MKKLTLFIFLMALQAMVWSQSTKKEVRNVEIANTKAVYLGTSTPQPDNTYAATSRAKKLLAKKSGQLPPNFMGRGKSKVTNPALEHQGPDPIRQTDFSQRARINIDPTVNIDGLSNSFGSPHDPSGSVGPNHYVQAINATTIGVYDKSGDLLSSFNANGLWLPLGETSLGDPIVLYDHEFDRWIITEFSRPAILLIAVSTSGNPLGSYNVYSFATPQFPDYPKYAIWSDHLVVTTNESGPGILHQYFFDRMALINGSEEVAIQRVQLNGNTDTEAGFYVTTPVHWNGRTAPADNNPIAVKINDSSWGQVADDMIEVFSFDIDFSNPDNTSVTKTEVITTPFDSYPCDNESGGFACVSQGRPIGGLDAIPEVIMNVPHYRNFGSYETMVMNFITDVTDGDNISGIRWVELRRTPGSDWELYQEGTFAPDDGLHRYMGSIAMDETGNIGLAYSVSGPFTFAGIRFTGRFADDPLGEMTVQETTLVDGTNVIDTDRYGDYPHMTVDPFDGQTFWFTSEYGGDGNANSLTRIAAFQLAKKDNDLAILEIGQPVTSTGLGDSETVTTTIQNLGSQDASGYEISLYLNEVLIETFTQTASLSSEEIYEHTFETPVDLSALGEYDIRIEVTLGEDQSTDNNTLSKTVKKLAQIDAGLSIASIETCVEATSGFITITNEGAGVLLTAEIETFRGSEPLETINWAGTLTSGNSEDVEFEITGLSGGVNQVSATIVSVNGTEDEVTENDSAEGEVILSDELELVTLELNTDEFGNETSWLIEDFEGNVLFEGGPYENLGTFTEQLCLPVDECYVFRIEDSEADGICCEFGEGSYSLLDSEGAVIFESTGQFGSVEETTVCVGNTAQVDLSVNLDDPGSACSNNLLSQFQITNLGEDNINTLDVDIYVNDALQETVNWRGDLSYGKSEFVRFTYTGLEAGTNTVSIEARNPNGVNDEKIEDNVDASTIDVSDIGEDESLSLVIRLDNIPIETTWIVTDDAEQILFSGGPYEIEGGQVIEPICLPDDQCYSLTILDGASDGICCNFGQGSYSVLNSEGETIIASSGFFGSSETSEICLGSACNLSIDVSRTDQIGSQPGSLLILATGAGGFEYSIDGGTTFQSSNFFNNLSGGDYEIVVRDNLDCEVTETVNVGTIVLGADEIESNAVVSPNPSTGVFNITFEGFESVDGFLELQIFDINGKLVQERKLSRYDETFRGQISLYAFPDGIYLVKPKNVETDQMVKIIKQ